MDFRSEERYACAALFTLALHLCQVDHGSLGEELESAWGQTDTDGSGSLEDCADIPQSADVAAAEWSAFWGWDCCGPGGILGRLYATLEIPEKAWAGLKRLPEVGGISPRHRQHYLQLVSSYIHVLDKDLPAVHRSSPKSPIPLCQQLFETANSREALCVGLSACQEQAVASCPEVTSGHDHTGGHEASTCEEPERESHNEMVTDSDSDLEEDLAKAGLQRRIIKQCSLKRRHSISEEALRPILPEVEEPADANGVATEPSLQNMILLVEEDSSEQESAQQSAGQQVHDGSSLHQPTASEEAEASLDEICEPQSCSSSQHGLELHRAATSPLLGQQVSDKALAVLWELLEACICRSQELTTTDRDPQPNNGALLGGMKPAVRWYDARQRCCLRLLASWLKVPWSMVTNFECLLVYRLLLPSDEAGLALTQAWEQKLRLAKIGAATVGIGALFALSGGLAAPAIAAGVGAAIGLAGGSTAVASGVTGFLATSAGGAVVASAVGAAGSGLAVGHVAHRIGILKEFGFWPLNRRPEGRFILTSESGSNLATHDSFFTEDQDSAQTALSNQVSMETAASQSPLVDNPSGEIPNQPQLELEVEELVGHVAANETQQSSVARKESELMLGQPNASEAPEASGLRRSSQMSIAADLRKRISEWPETLWPKLSSRGSAKQATKPEEGMPMDAVGKTAAEGQDQRQDLGHIFPPKESTKPDDTAAKETDRKESDQEEASKQPSEKGWQSMPRWSRKDKEGKLPSLLPAPLSPARKVEDMRVSVTIGVSGWIRSRRDFVKQWQALAGSQSSSEPFTLVWESRELKDLNSVIVDFATSQAGQEAAKWVLSQFFYTGLVAALAWPSYIYTAVQLIDTAWHVVLQRAQKAGRLLAHTLAAGAHGNRPVILVGTSMGARLIFHCLLELARLKAKGIVEHACLLGTPVAVRRERWAMARSVVAGRLINGYSRKDWLLAVVYRGANGFIKDAAGLGPIAFPGIENVNLTGLIGGHLDYSEKLGEILELIHLHS